MIELVAKELQHDHMPQNILRYQTYFIDRIVPNVAFLVRMGDNPIPTDWLEVKQLLTYSYRNAIGIELSQVRSLEESDFEFFATCPAWGAREHIPACNGNEIHPVAFHKFMEWFDGLVKAIKRSCLWGRRHCIYGFTSRHTAANLLATCKEVSTMFYYYSLCLR